LRLEVEWLKENGSERQNKRLRPGACAEVIMAPYSGLGGCLKLFRSDAIPSKLTRPFSAVLGAWKDDLVSGVLLYSYEDSAEREGYQKPDVDNRIPCTV